MLQLNGNNIPVEMYTSLNFSFFESFARASGTETLS